MTREYSLHEIEAIRNSHERAPVQVRQLQPLVRVTEQEGEHSLLKEAPAIVAAALQRGFARLTFSPAIIPNKGLRKFTRAHRRKIAAHRRAFGKIAALALFYFLLSAFCFAGDFLDAVAMVESSRNPRAVGDGGRAVGLFQFHRDAWEVARRIDPSVGEYINATDPARARPAAAAYFSWLRRQFQRHGISNPSPAQIYAAWNCGFTGFRTKYKFDVSRTPKTTRRACDLINKIIHEQ